MTSYADMLATLTAPGQEFEVVNDPVTGLRRFATTPASLRDLVDAASSDARLIWQQGSWWTAGEVRDHAVSLAQALMNMYGVRAGDRVALLGHNSPGWIAAFFAVVGIDAVVVPLNAWWSSTEIAWAVQDAGAVLVLAEARLVGRATVDVPVVVFDPMSPRGTASDQRRRWPDPAPSPASPATLLYTSGTSGSPKGVVSTHDAILQALWAFACRAATEPVPDPPADQAVTLLPVPLFHVTGSITVLLALRAGSSVVLMGRWDPALALRLVAQLRVTHVVAVPTQWWDLLTCADLASTDVSSLVRIGGGGAPAAPGLVRRLGDLLGRQGVGIGYGMTETNGYGPVSSGPDFLDHPDSCGRLVPIAEVQARDSERRAAPPGADGELWFRGPHLASGYWGDDEATAAAWVDGWLRTGDVGHVDASGRVYITGRQKEMILRGGENVSVAEVEAALFEHPEVREAAVLGIRDDRLGEVVAAVVVRTPGSGLTSAQLQAWLGERLAHYKVPTEVRWRDDLLPRTASGKLLRRPLKDDWPSEGAV